MSLGVIDELTRGSTIPFAPISVQQYHAMIAAGILHEGAPIELIDGLMVQKDRRDATGAVNMVGTRHATTVKRLARVLDSVLAGEQWHAQSQQPVTTNGSSEPEPDAAVVKGQPDDYALHHPGPADVPLVIEVADSSLGYDRTTKQRLYSTAGIPTYWIINLPDNLVEVYETPLLDAGRYQTCVTYRSGSDIPLPLPGLAASVAVSSILS